MAVRALIPHPASKGADGLSLEASAVCEGVDLLLAFRLRALIGDVRIAEGTPGARRDGLWRTTCFEAFLAGPAGNGYFEFNFSPAGEWAAYSFTAARMGMAAFAMEPPAIETVRSEDALILTARLALPAPPPLRVGLTAIIETTGGEMSWWALAHPASAPDFHHPGGFVYELTPA